MLYDDHQMTKRLESKRRLLLQKDLFELLQWMNEIESIHTDLNSISIIEKQLIKKRSLSLNIQGLRRKNTLTLSALCKYELVIKNEIEYGTADYDIKRSKEHEKQREFFMSLVMDYRQLKAQFSEYLFQFKIS